ncbi:MAG TPA: AMP-binding protein [Candidatus Acidoferrales bacterium]|jgi:fatty-acyl-CoA synthase|nr:AMP-binding protein [Candidatus Acidoferrales bacterium]
MTPLSYRRGPDAPILEKTIGQVIGEVAARFPDRDALISCHQHVHMSWREFDREIDRTARGLAGLGLAPGDRVGIWSGNCIEWVLLQMACARAGFILVNVNPAFRSHDLGFVLKKSRLRALAFWERDARADYGAILKEAVLEEAGTGQDLALEHTIVLGTPSWTRMLQNGSPLPGHQVLPGDPANIQYTSGTTGTPKGVLLTHRNLVNNAWLTGAWFGITEQDRHCNPCPLYHCAGSVVVGLAALLRGAALILPSAQFDAGAVLESIQAEQATLLAGVPAMYIAELEHPQFARFSLRSLRAAWMGGAPCPLEVLRRVKEQMGCDRVVVMYGQTESSPLITMSHPDEDFEKCACNVAGNVGCAMPNTEVKIASLSTGQTVPIGDAGELCTRGYLVMAGYDDEPESTSRAIDAEGWLHTGDVAVLDEGGHFRITGRAKEMIIRGGENIYPSEVEQFLFTHPKIAEVAVLGLPDRRLGEVVLAWVRLRAGESATEAEIREFCKGRIAHFKIPQHIRFVESFPATVSGKIQKFRIREFESREFESRALGVMNQEGS